MTLPTPTSLSSLYDTVYRLYGGYEQDYFLGFEYNGSCWINIYEQNNTSCADWLSSYWLFIGDANVGDHSALAYTGTGQATGVDYKPYRTVCVTKDFHGKSISL